MTDYQKNPDPARQLREAIQASRGKPLETRDETLAILPVASGEAETVTIDGPVQAVHTETLLAMVTGNPVGKPRMTRQDKWKERKPVVAYRNWCDHARMCVPWMPDANDIMEFSWTAYIGCPRSWSQKKQREHWGRFHRSKPDRDNIDKAILDCFFKEDSGIASGKIAKFWSKDPRLELEIHYLKPIIHPPTV